ncbi:hypothetical protein M3Y97_00138500 [Aphelenchoides bicaudatus]|nr:hypothetical protein M3Y97_00138500 [Aphelenchoides bicaudatus]
MRGIQLTVRYPDNTTRQLDNWSFAKAVANQEIIPEKNITVEDYYNNRYGKLRLPNAHLVKVKNNYYPAELLEISDNQEISNDQMDSRTKDVLANESSIRPDKMQTANRQASRVFRLQDSPYVQAAGIVVAPNTTRCNARVLPTPTICGPNTRWRLPENGESSWPIKRLLNPKPCKGFAIYVIGGNQLPVDLKDFAQNFQRTAGRLGMNLGPCQDSGLYAENQIETCIKYCADPTKNIELCIFITPEHAIHCHEDIKYFERRHGVITQDLKPKTLRRLLAGDQSIYENCVLKANIKLGGLNYSLEVENREVMNELQETMIIGISSANLPEQKSIPKRNSSISDGKPNVLGYSVNSGDFLYSPADNSSQHNNLRKIFKSCAQRFKENRGQSPRKVLLYFYGLTQEQYKDCLKFYVPMIQLGIREANNKIDIPLTIMPVTKKNNFPPDQCKKNYEFNVPHGIVVDSTIVNPIFNEFFLMSHSAPSGTANIPRYTVVFDQNSYSMNVLEELSHNLCYQHQIDGVSTALPTVIGVAEDYAGRGRDLFNAAIRNNHSLPYTNDGQPDLDRLTQILNYSDSRFNNVRITA